MFIIYSIIVFVMHTRSPVRDMIDRIHVFSYVLLYHGQHSSSLPLITPSVPRYPKQTSSSPVQNRKAISDSLSTRARDNQAHRPSAGSHIIGAVRSLNGRSSSLEIICNPPPACSQVIFRKGFPIHPPRITGGEEGINQLSTVSRLILYRRLSPEA